MKKTQDEPIREFKLKDVKFVFDPKRSTKKIRGHERSSVRCQDHILGENKKSQAELESLHAIIKCAG